MVPRALLDASFSSYTNFFFSVYVYALSVVKIVVLKFTIVMYDPNRPIINMDGQGPPVIFVFHQRFLLLENVYSWNPPMGKGKNENHSIHPLHKFVNSSL